MLARKIILAVSAALLSISASQSASAQASNVFVSITGNDANTCVYDSPCKSLTTALSKLSEGGTLTCIDAQYTYEFFSSLNISKGVTIDCAAGGARPVATALVIDAPGKDVKIRNLNVSNYVGASVPLIDIVNAASVYLENVTVNRSNLLGIRDRRTGPAKLYISNSDLFANNGPALVIAPQGGSTIAVLLDNVRARNSGYGLAVAAGGRVSVVRSTFFGNFTAGIAGDPGAIIEVEDSLIANNPTGIQASPGAVISVSNSRINSNNNGINGNTTSYGNNKFFANANSDGTPPTPAALK